MFWTKKLKLRSKDLNINFIVQQILSTIFYIRLFHFNHNKQNFIHPFFLQQIDYYSAIFTLSIYSDKKGLIDESMRNIDYAEIVKANSVPIENQFELFHQLRLTASLSDYSRRRQMLLIHLYAMAIYCIISQKMILINSVSY